MAKLVLFNVRAFVGIADLTGQSNKIEIVDAMEEKDVTNFGSSSAKEVLGGVESVALAGEGQFNAGGAGLIDDVMWANRRAIEAWSIGPDSAAVGSAAYLTKAVRLSSKLFGSVGDVAPWSLTAGGDWPMARGAFLSAPATAITADANGTGVQLGAVAAGQRLYACIHVLSVAGTLAPTLAVTIESDSSNAFASPVTVLTFATASATTSEAVRTGTLGNTDTWYRAVFDVTDNGGVGASFLALVSAGIA
jgi:hypothetical protein